MSASQAGSFNIQAFTDDGAPLVGGRLYTYTFGTTTQKTAYTDHAGIVPHAYVADGDGGQYIELNARGELPAPLYLSGGSYDLALKTASGATIWTRRADPVLDIGNDLSGPGGAALIGFQPTLTTSATTVQSAIVEVAADAQAALTAAASIAGPSGSAAVGFVGRESDATPSNVQSELRDLNANKPVGAIPNIGAVANRNCTILGDSITHGAFALNTFMHGWVRIFERMFNAEIGASSYGFTNLLALGAGADTTTDIHAVSFTGAAWNVLESATTPATQEYPTGSCVRATDNTSLITITVPSFQSRARIYFGKLAGGLFTVKNNGVLITTVDTNIGPNWSTCEIPMTDNGYGDNVITIQPTAGQIDIIGISYVSWQDEPVVNNFSFNGRRLRYVSETVISALMADSATMIMALGINDQSDADSDDTYYAEFMKRITWLTAYANQYGARMVVPDFCWSVAKSSRTRAALRKLAADTGGIYIDLPGEIFKNRESITPGAARQTYIITTLKMWTDGSHPNKLGHQWIAETIAKRMGLSCSSKAQAIAYYDWWMPMALKSAVLVYNYFPNAAGNISAYRRNGSLIVGRVFVGKNGAAPFSTGQFIIADAWRAKSELSASQDSSGNGVVRSDTDARVSTLFVSAGGQINLRVLDATWTPYQNVYFAIPA